MHSVSTPSLFRINIMQDPSNLPGGEIPRQIIQIEFKPSDIKGKQNMSLIGKEGAQKLIDFY